MSYISVIEKLSDNLVEFESKEDFEKYYAINKNSIDKMATRGLNTKYLIPGYKLGRKNGELKFIPTISSNTIETTDSYLEDKLDQIMGKICKLEKTMNIILSQLQN